MLAMEFLPISANTKSRQITNLRSELDAFYAKTATYDAFSKLSNQVACWEFLLPVIRENIRANGEVSVLEVGAGRTGFTEYIKAQLKDDVSKVRFHAQDVTDQNVDHLNAVADEVLVGDIRLWKDRKQFDVIFSTHVFEHVTNPHEHLDILLSLLTRPKGQLFIFSPSYDFPFYMNPAARHLSLIEKIILGAYVLMRRLTTLLSGRPAFLIQKNPAVLVQPFFRDSDAIHWVSYFDIRAWTNQRGLKLKIFRRRSSAASLSKDGLIKLFGTLNVRITFNETSLK